MARKKSAKPPKATLAKILSTVERGFAATAEDIADLRTETKAGISDLRKEMATKRDIAGIMEELADIKRRLKDVEAAIEDHAGHSKEIDHALERIAAIEKHLGITKKIAA